MTGKQTNCLSGSRIVDDMGRWFGFCRKTTENNVQLKIIGGNDDVTIS